MQNLTVINPSLIGFDLVNFKFIAPYFFILIGIVMTVFASVLSEKTGKILGLVSTVTTVVAAIYSTIGLLGFSAVSLFNNMIVVDAYSNFFNIVYLLIAVITVISSVRYLDKENIQYQEYNVMILLSTIGMMLMTAASELIVFFISLEIMSLSVYTLVCFRRSDRRSNEAAMKYFIMGGVASAVLLYGVAMLYGATGSTHFLKIFEYAQLKLAQPSLLYTAGSFLVIIGFLFKVAAVPFHMWMPDVYEGAPTPITGFMTTALKTSVFAVFVKILISTGYTKAAMDLFNTNLHHFLWIAAVLTMLAGNVIALTQVNLKRMLAYSSIAHTGYLLVGLISAKNSGMAMSAVGMYLVVYSVMNLGAFLVLTLISNKSDTGLNLHDLSGISKKHPCLAACFGIFMLSMAGIPPTAGFIAKYQLLYSAVDAGELVLVVLAVLCSAISVFYYLRVLVYMYMHESSDSGVYPIKSMASNFALLIMAFFILKIGFFPAPLMDLAKRVMNSI